MTEKKYNPRLSNQGKRKAEKPPSQELTNNSRVFLVSGDKIFSGYVANLKNGNFELQTKNGYRINNPDKSEGSFTIHDLKRTKKGQSYLIFQKPHDIKKIKTEDILGVDEEVESINITDIEKELGPRNIPTPDRQGSSRFDEGLYSEYIDRFSSEDEYGKQVLDNIWEEAGEEGGPSEKEIIPEKIKAKQLEQKGERSDIFMQNLAEIVYRSKHMRASADIDVLMDKLLENIGVPSHNAMNIGINYFFGGDENAIAVRIINSEMNATKEDIIRGLQAVNEHWKFGLSEEEITEDANNLLHQIQVIKEQELAA